MKIHVIDCTLRDGGNLNNWCFDREDTKRIITGLDSARVDFIEVGYRGGSSSNKNTEVGQHAFCSNSFLDEVSRTTHARIALMVIPSVCPLEKLNDLNPDTVPIVRLAAYPNDFDEAVPYITYLKDRGFKVCMNLMAGSYASSKETVKYASTAWEFGADIFYIADSFGSLTPTAVGERVRAVREQTGCPVGFHGHNNLGLAFANALEALRAGATYIDTSLCGMARGAGNLPTEQFVSAITHWGEFGTDYLIHPVLEAAEHVLHKILRQPLSISSPEIICGVGDIHYYYYSMLDEFCSNNQFDRLKVALSLGGLKPIGVDYSYLNQAIEKIKR